MKKKKKKGLTKFETTSCKFLGSICIFLVVATVFSQVSLSQINLEVQKLRVKVKEQEDVNTSISMKINELASLENIQEISEQEGLSYNSENIKTIE